MVVQVWKCRSRRQSTRSSTWRKKSGTWRTSSSGLSSAAAIHRYLASDNCPWPSRALARVSSSRGRRLVLVGDVALAADGQQQRMDAGRLDGVDRPHARDRPRNHRPGQLVDQLAEHRVFLRRAADHRERPDRVVAMVDALDQHHREIVRQAVVAQVIAEGSLGQLPRGVEVADDAEVGLGVDGQLVAAGRSSARGGRPACRRRPAR